MNGAKASRQRAEAAGRWSERIAGLLLRLKGFAILEARYKTPVGEIDLVAKRGNLVAFVEVKARPTTEEALGAVSHHARRRIIAAADAFVSRHPHLAHCDMRYDIIAVAGWRMKHVTNAWRSDD